MQRTGILGVKMMETERKKAAKEIVVAIDHGLSFPETVGLERPIDLLRELIRDRGNVPSGRTQRD